MPIGVVIGFCSAVLTAVVTEVYAHRCLAHRAFRIHPVWPLLRLAAAIRMIDLDQRAAAPVG